MLLVCILTPVGKKAYIVGTLYRAIGKSSAITTDPWGSLNRTITYADHRRIEPGEVVLLVEHLDMDDAGAWIWLHHDRVIWQVMSNEKFKECWKEVAQDK